MKKAVFAIVGLVIAVLVLITYGDPVIGTVISLAGIALIALTGFASFWRLSPNCGGEPRFWGWRAPYTVRNWMFWIPEFLGGKVENFPVGPQDLEDGVEVVVGDNVKLVLSYYLQWRVDDTLKDKKGPNKGRSTFLGNAINAAACVDVVVKKAKADIKSKVGALGGIETSDDFKLYQKNVEDYLSASLRMKTPPHKAAGVPAAGIIKFHEANWEMVGEAIRSETDDPEDRSPLEESCGIDILAFRLMNPKFTPEMEAALEKKRQEEARAAGGEMQRNEARAWIDLGLKADEAADAAQVALLGIQKKIVAVRGSGQAIVVEGGIPGIGGGGGKGGDKGGSGGKGGKR